jgi:hypothetical protein
MNTEVLLIGFGLSVILGHLLFRRGNPFVLVAAATVAAVWVGTYSYEYSANNHYIGGISVFPFVLWTAALIVVTDLHLFLFKRRWYVTAVAWVLLVIVAEYWGYHYANIHLSSNYPGLPYLDILHGTTVLKVFYLTAGPVFAIFLERTLHRLAAHRGLPTRGSFSR